MCAKQALNVRTGKIYAKDYMEEWGWEENPWGLFVVVVVAVIVDVVSFYVRFLVVIFLVFLETVVEWCSWKKVFWRFYKVNSKQFGV